MPGAIAFHGSVAAVLFRAAVALGRKDDAKRWRDIAESDYRRLGSTWWLETLGVERAPSREGIRIAHLRPTANRLWIVGFDGLSSPMPEAKGLRYLNALLAKPATDLSALELVGRVEGHDEVIDSDAGEISTSRRSSSINVG